RRSHGRFATSARPPDDRPRRADGRRQDLHRPAPGAAARPRLRRRRSRDRRGGRLLHTRDLHASRRAGGPRRRTARHPAAPRQSAACAVDRRRRLHGCADPDADSRARHLRLAARRPRPDAEAGVAAQRPAAAPGHGPAREAAGTDDGPLPGLCGGGHHGRQRRRSAGGDARTGGGRARRASPPPAGGGRRQAGGPVIQPDRLTVELGPRSYDILMGRGLMATAGQHLRPLLKQPRVVVLTDRTVASLHLPTLTRALDDAGIAHGTIVLPPGEQTKSFEHLEEVIDRLLAARIERNATVVALGGGVIGDLAGFAASIVLRGIDAVQIPTTLLAQVDSSVGGKTGIDTRWSKNLVSSFHQPLLVLADIDALATLPRRELLAGYAEVVKYGLINDPGFFAWLEDHGSALVDGDEAARQRAVRASCAAKAKIVAADERESGARALLNLGHTFGHALEAECG